MELAQRAVKQDMKDIRGEEWYQVLHNYLAAAHKDMKHNKKIREREFYIRMVRHEPNKVYVFFKESSTRRWILITKYADDI